MLLHPGLTLVVLYSMCNQIICSMEVATDLADETDPSWMLPNFYKRLLIDEDTQNSYNNEVNYEQMCLIEGTSCNPWSKRCCSGSQCVNYAQRFCLSEFERCTCFPSNIYQHREPVRNSLWYRKRSALR